MPPLNLGTKVGEAFGRITVVLAGYGGIWKATSAIASTKGDVKRWKGGASGRDNIFVTGDIGSSISIKTKELSFDIFTKLFGGTIATGHDVGVFPPDHQKVVAGKVTLAHLPAGTNLAVYGKMDGQKTRFIHDPTNTVPQTNAGSFAIVGAVIDVEPTTHNGQYLHVEYDYYSSSAKYWTPDPWFSPPKITGYFTCLWGGDQPTGGRPATVYFTDVSVYSPDFKNGADADALNADNEIILELDEDSILEVVFS